MKTSNLKKSLILFFSVILLSFLSSCKKEDEERNSANTSLTNLYANITFNGATYAVSNTANGGTYGGLAADNGGIGWAATIQSNTGSKFTCSFFLGDGLVGSYPSQGIQFSVAPFSQLYRGNATVVITSITTNPKIVFEGSFSGTVQELGTNNPLVPINGSFKVGANF